MTSKPLDQQHYFGLRPAYPAVDGIGFGTPAFGALRFIAISFFGKDEGDAVFSPAGFGRIASLFGLFLCIIILHV